jgi:hypothetical protein
MGSFDEIKTRYGERGELGLGGILVGLFAYDSGATDSGFKDDLLKAEVKEFLATPGIDLRPVMNRIVVESFLDDESTNQGYGLADVQEFLEWLHDEMGFEP